MSNNNCCENLNQLRNNGYLNRELVYLQRLDVETDFPMNLRLHNYCAKCVRYIGVTASGTSSPSTASTNHHHHNK